MPQPEDQRRAVLGRGDAVELRVEHADGAQPVEAAEDGASAPAPSRSQPAVESRRRPRARSSSSSRWHTTSVSVCDRSVWPRRDQLAPQLGVVLDDAVVDDRQAPLAIQVRMGVGLGHAAVGRPARVPERRARWRQSWSSPGRSCRCASRPAAGHARRPAARGDAPGVVAAVLELLQPGQHQLRRFVAVADVPEYPAHTLAVLLSSCERRRCRRAVGQRHIRATAHARVEPSTLGRCCRAVARRGLSRP